MFGRRDCRTSGGGGAGTIIRVVIALVIAGAAVVGYMSKRVYNPVTNEVQHVSINPQQEVAIGLQAAPQMAAQYGGLDPDKADQDRVRSMGERLVKGSDASQTKYPFEFHALADAQTVNAFALPGGPVFITKGLLSKLTTDGQLAGVLGHEIGHVVARHGAQHMAKAELTQGLTGAAVLATYDPNHPTSAQAAQIAIMAGQLINLKYGRDDELEADKLGVKFEAQCGYDPRAMLGVMDVLKKAAGSGRQPEFFSTHPNPEHREERIQEAIKAQYPNGVPDGLKP